MNKPPAWKQILHEEVQELKKVGGYWKWQKPPEHIGDGYYRTSCTLVREQNDPNPIKAVGEGKGKKGAEHAAAYEILKIIESTAENFDNDSGKDGKTSEASVEPNYSSRNDSTTDANYEAAMIIFNALLVYLPPQFKKQKHLHSHRTRNLHSNSEYIKVLLANLSRDLESSAVVDENKRIDDPPKQQNSTSTHTPSFTTNKSSCVSDANLLNQPSYYKRRSILDPQPSKEAIRLSDKVYYYPEIFLGAGKFSQVYRGYLEDECRTKVIKKVTSEDAVLIEGVKCEDKSLEKLKKLNREYFIQYYFTEKLDAHVYYVFEPADCTLEFFITESQPVEDQILKKICQDVSKGLNNLHEQKMIHGDISPQNVFICLGDKNSVNMPTAKLTAFGVSRVLNQAKQNKNEDFEGKRSRDIFQLGLTFGFTMTAGIPLVDLSDLDELNLEQLDIKWNLLNEPKFYALRNLLEKILQKNLADQVEISELLKHPFFWDDERSISFIFAVVTDIKHNKAPSEKIQFEYEEYTYQSGITDNWKLRLDTPIQDWILKEQRKMEEEQLIKPNKKKKPWQYKSQSIIHLIKFIRDQHQHYGNWTSVVDDSSKNRLEDENVWGHKGCNYGQYFVTKFPELTTILYNVMQREEFQGNLTKSFYLKNSGMGLDLAKVT